MVPYTCTDDQILKLLLIKREKLIMFSVFDSALVHGMMIIQSNKEIGTVIGLKRL